jgi:ribosomal protein S12 methylthiotransferase accessory factor
LRVATTYLNDRIELFPGDYGSEQSEALRLLPRLYNRTLGPVTSLNLLRPEPLDLSLYSAYCAHVPLQRLVRDVTIRGRPNLGLVPGGGKGAVALQALRSALGEVTERLLATLNFTSSHVRLEHATYNDLRRKGRRALGPEEVPLFASEQYARPGFPYAPFAPDAFMAWIEGTELLTGEPVLVPAQLVLMYHVRHPAEVPIGYATTSGLSFHASRREAILHGLYEVVERDALNVCWYSKVVPPRVEVDLAEVVAEHFGVRSFRMSTPPLPSVDVLLLTLDLPLPAFAAIGVDRFKSERAFVGGTGAAYRREQALAQALCELGQCQTGFRFEEPFGRGRGPTGTDLEEVVEFFDAPLHYGYRQNLARISWFTASEQRLPWEAVPTRRFADVHEEYDATIEWLRSERLNPVVVDCDDAWESSGAVTKVYVPELSHACPPRNPPLGHPRFYDLPCRLGLTDRPLTFDDLNPDPIPFA